MDRKTTIKILRDIIRKIEDEFLFEDIDFNQGSSYIPNESKVSHYIKNRLGL